MGIILNSHTPTLRSQAEKKRL